MHVLLFLIICCSPKRLRMALLCQLVMCMGATDAMAQTGKIEALKKTIATSRTVNDSVSALLLLCEQKYSLNPDTLKKYATIAKQLSQVTQNQHQAILADYYLTYSLLVNIEEDSSLTITNRYLQHLEHNQQEQEAYLLFLQLKGLIYYRTNKTKDAINTFFTLQNEALQRKNILIQVLAKRGILMSYTITGQDLEALKWVHEAVGIIPDTASPHYRDIFGLLHTNAAICFLHLYQASHLQKYADSCEYYGTRAVAIGKETDNLFTQCQGLIVRGLILSYLHKIPEAEKNLQQGLLVRRQIGDTLYIISDMSVLASFYANTKQLDKGVAICNLGIALAQRRKESSALLLLLYHALAENYRANHQYEKLADALQQLMTVKDSLNKKNSADELASFQAKYDVQKQETTIIQQKLDMIKQHYLYYATLFFFMSAGFVAFFLNKSYRKRARQKMERLLEAQQLKEKIAILSAEEKERKRIAADLHDNLGAYAAAISNNVRNVKDAGQYSAALTDRLDENAQDIVNELNNTIWVLKKESQQLTEIGDRLKVWLQKLIHNYPHIQYDFIEDIESDVLMSPANALQLYHILQECINNALRHSQCTIVAIALSSSQTNWRVTIADDGIGFSPETVLKGNGIHNLQERALACGWSICWEIDHGTRVTVSS